MKDWTSAERMGKIGVAIIDKLATEFHKAANQPEDKKNYDRMIRFAQATAYQITVYSSLQKAHEYERRLIRVEKTVKHIDPSDMVMRYSPVITAEDEEQSKEQYR